MTLYSFALLIHILGVLGLFVGISLEMAVVFRLGAVKTTAQVHEWMAFNRAIQMILPISALLVLLSGLFMLFSMWGWGHAWIDLSLGSLVILGALGPVINGPRMMAIQKAVEVAPDGQVTASLQKRISDPVLRAYAPIPGFMAVGVVALMTLKLDWIVSGVVMISLLIVGLISGQLSQGFLVKHRPSQVELH